MLGPELLSPQVRPGAKREPAPELPIAVRVEQSDQLLQRFRGVGTGRRPDHGALIPEGHPVLRVSQFYIGHPVEPALSFIQTRHCVFFDDLDHRGQPGDAKQLETPPGDHSTLSSCF